MREIKFRVWDKERKIMYYLSDDRWGFGGNSEYSVLSWEDVFAEQYDELISLQYIGRKDKNGEEIYNGDIVEFNNYENGEMYKGLVVFHDCSFCIDVFDDYDYRYMRKFHYIKILGNKYENPELLKEDKDERN